MQVVFDSIVWISNSEEAKNNKGMLHYHTGIKRGEGNRLFVKLKTCVYVCVNAEGVLVCVYALCCYFPLLQETSHR